MRLLFFFLFSAVSLSAVSQIAAQSPVVDFGVINEEDGPKSIRTYIRNIGDETVSLLKVRPTCGCTAADFQKDPVAPGDSAWIDLTYNPFRRPGRFEKYVKITPTRGAAVDLPVTGLVMASEATLENFFPVNTGLLRLSADRLMPARTLSTRQISLKSEVYNPGSSPLWFAVECEDPAVSLEVFPDSLLPGEAGVITAVINPMKEERNGDIVYTLKLYSSSDSDALYSGEPYLITIHTVTEKPK